MEVCELFWPSSDHQSFLDVFAAASKAKESIINVSVDLFIPEVCVFKRNSSRMTIIGSSVDKFRR